MSVTIELAEQRALVKMLLHEHFAYGDEGVLALRAFKKISAAADAGRELTFVDGEEERSAGRLMDLLKRLRDCGCPTYLCRDGSRTRDGVLLCVYCEQPATEGHAEGCVWIDVLKIVGP